MRYRVGKTPNLRAPNNRKTWLELESKIGSGNADFDALVRWCKNHDHPSGGHGFVEYCIDNSWLVEIDRIKSVS